MKTRAARAKHTDRRPFRSLCSTGNLPRRSQYDADCADGDDTGPVDELGTMGEADPVVDADADELDDALPGYFISMFSLRIDRFCSFNGCSSRPYEHTRKDRQLTSIRTTIRWTRTLISRQATKHATPLNKSSPRGCF